MDKPTRNAIERATQRARRLSEDDFAAQLEGTFDVLRNGTIAAKTGAHLSARRCISGIGSWRRWRTSVLRVWVRLRRLRARI